MEGFKFLAEGHRDNEKKIHPFIVPNEDLPADQRIKDTRNVNEALKLGISRFNDAPRQPCWRKRVRIGLIGPLDIDSAVLFDPIKDLLIKLRNDNPELDAGALEILTPNAPGFDREGARLITTAWKEQTGRAARLLLLNAVSADQMDKAADTHIAKSMEAPNMAILHERIAGQTRALHALQKQGHQIRHLDLRPLGTSDADLMAESERFKEAIQAAQDHLLALADEMVFFTRNGSADWTMRAVKKWKSKGGQLNILS